MQAGLARVAECRPSIRFSTAGLIEVLGLLACPGSHVRELHCYIAVSLASGMKVNLG